MRWGWIGLCVLFHVAVVTATNICTALPDNTACLLADGQSVGVCLGEACTRTFTLPGGETRTGTGTIDISASGAVTGTGTAFTAELHVGDVIQCAAGPLWWTVVTINSATSVTADASCSVGYHLGLSGPCPTCAGATFVYRNAIQEYLDAGGNVVGSVDGLGRYAIDGPIALATGLTIDGPATPAVVSSGNGIDQPATVIVFDGTGGGTSATGATAGMGTSEIHVAGAGGTASGSGGSKGGIAGGFLWETNDGGRNTASGDGGDSIGFRFHGGKGGPADGIGVGGTASSFFVALDSGGSSVNGLGGEGGNFEVTAGAAGTGGGGSGTGGHVRLTAVTDFTVTGSGGSSISLIDGTTVIDGVAYVFPGANSLGVLGNDGSGNLSWGFNAPLLVDTQDLTGRTADITDTAFANTNTAGLYEVNYYLEDTAADITAGAVTLNIKFNDGTAVRTLSSAALVLTSTATAPVQGVFSVRLGSGSVTYGTTHTGIFGSATYGVSAWAKRVR